MAPAWAAELKQHYDHSVKAWLVAFLELELSMQLVLSFFETTDEDEQDEQELQTLYTLSWVPLLFSVLLVYGHRVAPKIAPEPENEDRNMLRLKIFTWLYSLVFLIWDKDMTVKTGPALGIAIIFCVCDLARFQMEVHRLIEDYTDDEEDESDVEYAVHMLGLDEGNADNPVAGNGPAVIGSSAPLRAGEVRQNVQVNGAAVSATVVQAAARLALQPYRNKNNRYMLKKTHSSQLDESSAPANLSIDKSPSQIDSEFVAVLEERPKGKAADPTGKRDEAPAKSFVYEF